MRKQPCVIARIDKRMAEFFAVLSKKTAMCSPDGAQRNPGFLRGDGAVPDCAAFHPGYRLADLHFLGVEDQQIGAAAGEFRHISAGRLAFRATECGLDVGHAVEGEDGDEVNA